MVKRRSTQLAASLEEIRRSYEFTLDALVAMLDARERQAGKHSIRTRELAVILARKLNLTGDDLESVASGAFLHDIGKIGIPDSILLKPGQLLPEEWEIMKTHSEIGYNILRSSPSLKHAAEVVRSHHERYDGSGYPRGLKGDEICIGARVFAVVDAYDTMRTTRVYRNPVGSEEASAEVRRCSGTQFDPQIVDAFLECREEMEAILGGRDGPHRHA
jgi:putative nucleotidyltransferase with HDIG domain